MVIIQAGHQNIETNCDTSMRSGTGAPGERDWTPSIAAWVAATLVQLGVPARAVDANFNCTPDVVKDYTAFVAIHYQANLPTASGYYAGVGDPSQDGNAAGSANLKSQIDQWYQKETGLKSQPGWNNLNIEHYYLFEVLSSKTPYVLIECGVGAPGAPDHDFLWSTAGKDKVCRGILNGILTYMTKAPYAPSSGPPAQLPGQADPCADVKTQLDTALAQLKAAVETVGTQQAALAAWSTWAGNMPK